MQHGVRWTPRDDARLRRDWGDVDIRWLARALGRTPSAVRGRAITLGLPLGVQRGHVSLHHAAQRAGYCHLSMRRAVAWWTARGGEVSCSSLPAVLGSCARGQWRQIDPDDAEEIARAYASSELTGQASARLGITRETLRRRAIAAGHRVGHGQQLRLLPHEWDAVSYPTKGPKKCPAP